MPRVGLGGFGRKGGGVPLGIETSKERKTTWISLRRKGGGVPLGIETKKALQISNICSGRKGGGVPLGIETRIIVADPGV